MVSVVVVRCRKIEALPCRALSQKVSKQMENRKANTPIALRKQIGGTMYCVKVHFNEDAKETMKDKIKRMLENDVKVTEHRIGRKACRQIVYIMI